MKKLNLLSLVVPIAIIIFLSGCTNDNKKIDTNSIDDQIVDNNTDTVSDSTFTMLEVNQHASRNDCWTVIEGKVYDITEYVLSGEHKPVIVEGCGIDATDKFNAVEKHSISNLDKYYIGALK